MDWEFHGKIALSDGPVVARRCKLGQYIIRPHFKGVGSVFIFAFYKGPDVNQGPWIGKVKQRRA